MKGFPIALYLMFVGIFIGLLHPLRGCARLRPGWDEILEGVAMLLFPLVGAIWLWISWTRQRRAKL